MPNAQHYSGSSQAYTQGRDGFAGNNAQMASTPAGPSHPVQHQQPHQPAAVYPQAPYRQPGNAGSANQHVQMPTAAPLTDRRYAHHSEVATAGGQPQFAQTRFPPETYPQYGYAPTGNVQPAVYGTAYPPDDSRGYHPPGSGVSPANGQRAGYTNGTYPPMDTQYGQPAYSAQVHNSGQMSRMAARPAAHDPRNAAGCQPSSQQFGVTGSTGGQVDPSSQRPQSGPSSHRSAPAHQQAMDATEEQHSASSPGNSRSQANNSTHSHHRQTAHQNSNPHIVKPPVLRSTTAGNFCVSYACFKMH